MKVKAINEESLSVASKRLMISESFYGLFLMQLEKHWTDEIPTSGVGKHGINVRLYINEVFWESLKDVWRLFCLKHDLLHIVFHHIELGENLPEKDIVMLASNITVNQWIDPTWIPLFDVKYKDYMELNKELIELLHEDLRHKNKTREEVIEELKKIPPRGIYFEDLAELKLKPKEGLIYYYEELLKYKKNEPKPGGKGYCQALSNALRDVREDFPSLDEHDWKDFEGMSETEKKLIMDQVDFKMKEVAEQVIKSRGTVPSEIEGYLKGLDKSDPPKFDWRGYTRRFAGGSQVVDVYRTRSKYNIRFPDSPGRKIRPRKRGLLFVDTSGSMSDGELLEAFHEAYHLQKMGIEITIVQFDAGIHSIKEYKTGLEDELKITGRGGTDYDCVVDYINDNHSKYSFAIVFTDGECPAPKDRPKLRVLWVHSSKSPINEDLPGLKIQLPK